MPIQVTERERRGDYCGKTVQMIPHLTDAIIEWIERVAKIPVDNTNQTPDVCIIEVVVVSHRISFLEKR